MTQGLLYSFKTIEIFILYRLILDIIKPCVSYMWDLVGFKNKKIKILHVNSKWHYNETSLIKIRNHTRVGWVGCINVPHSGKGKPIQLILG